MKVPKADPGSAGYYGDEYTKVRATLHVPNANNKRIVKVNPLSVSTVIVYDLAMAFQLLAEVSLAWRFRFIH